MGRSKLYRQMYKTLIDRGYLKAVLAIFAPVIVEYLQEHLDRRAFKEGMKESLQEVLKRIERMLRAAPKLKRA